MQDAVAALRTMGRLPDSSADATTIEAYERLLLNVREPVTDQEAEILASLFGDDDCYGLAWTLLHLIETAPGWPLERCLTFASNEWIVRLRKRAENGRRLRE